MARRRGDTASLDFLPATTRALHAAAARLRGVEARLEPLLDWIARIPEAAPTEPT